LQISRENASTSSSPSTKKIFPPFNNMAAANQHKNLNSQSIWQINLHKCSEANSLLVDDALNEAKIPIVLITEPFCNKNKKVEFTTKGYTIYSVASKPGERTRAAIALPNHINGFMKHEFSDLDTVVVIIQDKTKGRTLCIVSAYLDINYSPAMGRILQNTVSESEALNWDLLVAADSNSHSTTWGSATQNPRGTEVEGFIATNDLVLQNVGNAFTYVSSRYKTIIDITLTNHKLASNIYDWEVRNEETHSDHKRITYSLDFDTTSSRESRDYSTANWGLFGAILTRKTHKLDPNPKWDKRRLDLAAEKIEIDIMNAVDKICPKKVKQVGLSKPGSPDWFTPETKKLSNIAKECIRLHRMHPTTETLLRHRDAKRKLQKNIRNNQKACEQNLITLNPSQKWLNP
jgi:hypothetical protein